MKPALCFLGFLLCGLLFLPACRHEPAVSTQELKSWSSNIEVRVQMLESNQVRFNSSTLQPFNSSR